LVEDVLYGEMRALCTPFLTKSTNLFCAASLLFFDGELRDALCVLEDEDPTAWRFTNEGIGWRDFRWNSEQIQSVRRNFLTSFGSCSFEEPLRDLETLGWL